MLGGKASAPAFLGCKADATLRSRCKMLNVPFRTSSSENVVVSVPPEKEAQRLLRAFAVLMRNTTWKCGRVERQVVNYLRPQLTRFGYGKLPVRDILSHFRLSGKKKSEFLDAIRRLEKRHIIKLETL